MDILALLPQFGSVIWTVVAFVVALSVIVAIHEYGHYIVGRWSGIHAEVFSLGFGPVLWSRVDKRGTRWQFALFPLGGFVKFLGDANAASGEDGAAMQAMPDDMLRHTMHGAPLWARAATVAAGPVFNFILSILVFSAVILSHGQVVEPLRVGEMRPLPVQVQGLQKGDEVLGIGGVLLPDAQATERAAEFEAALNAGPELEYEIRRDGREMVVKGPNMYPPLVDQVSPQSAAYSAGLEAGDVVTAIDGQEVFTFQQLKTLVEASDGQPLVWDVWRNGEILKFTIAPRVVDEPQPEGGFKKSLRIGIAGGMAFEPAREAPGIGAALWAAVEQTWRIISGSVSGLYHMITGAISSCNISGPLGIAQVSGQMASQGAQSFVWFIGVLSAAVGMLNLFPIPVLDGGHLVFYAYEAVTGRKPSEKVLRLLMMAGLFIILSLMIFGLGNDLFCR